MNRYVMQTRFYLDANAGTPLLPEVRDAIVATLGDAANPSSIHASGRKARGLVEDARAEVAGAVGAKPENVIFTSGATEAAALALTPRLLSRRDVAAAGRLYVGATEHPCVLSGGRFPSNLVTRLPVEPSGRLDLDTLRRALDAHDYGSGAPYLALMLANNETGIIHPVAEAARIVKRRGGFVFCDAVQGLGRIPVDIGALGVDFMSLTAHKLGGPQGAGALILADEELRPEPLLLGGGQERRRRAGTENVISIVGFSVAVRRAMHHLSNVRGILALRAEIERQIWAISPEARIVGMDSERLANTTMFAVPGMLAETLVLAFDLAGIAVSAGSACSSGKVGASHVLEAMGEPAEIARAGVRVSLPADADAEDIEAFTVAWRGIYTRMRQGRAA